MASEALPESYDLRDVDGGQFVNTRLEDQVGPGPCWAFAAMVAIESNILVYGLWSGAADELDLSQQWLRMNESNGYGGKHTWNEDPDTMTEGLSRTVNAGGNWQVATAHMARLHGPVLEVASTGSTEGDLADGRPFVYRGDLDVNDDYYDGSSPKWPERGYYQADFQFQQALKWEYAEDDSDQHAALRQCIREHGALYVSFSHKDGAFTAGAGPDGLGIYYDDGNVASGGLGGHGINFIGWDDSVATGAVEDGAWLVKQSHPTATSPSYFWLAYSSVINHVVSYRMGSRVEGRTVYSHAYGYMMGTSYKPDHAHDRKAASVYAVGDSDQVLDALSFETDRATAYTITLLASLDDLRNAADPLASVTGTTTGAGYHMIQLEQPVTVTAGSSFVVSLETPEADLPWSYYADSAGNSSAVERTHAGEHYYYDTSTATWKDVYYGFGDDFNHATNCAWTMRAYSSGSEAPSKPVRRLGIAAFISGSDVIIIDPVCNDDPAITPVIDGDHHIFTGLETDSDHGISFQANPTGSG